MAKIYKDEVNGNKDVTGGESTPHLEFCVHVGRNEVSAGGMREAAAFLDAHTRHANNSSGVTSAQPDRAPDGVEGRKNSHGSEPVFSLDEMMPHSNIGPHFGLGEEFFATARAAADERRRGGFSADGKPGGEFSEENPPEGKEFAGYLKGCTGIVWKTKE